MAEFPVRICSVDRRVSLARRSRGRRTLPMCAQHPFDVAITDFQMSLACMQRGRSYPAHQMQPRGVHDNAPAVHRRPSSFRADAPSARCSPYDSAMQALPVPAVQQLVTASNFHLARSRMFVCLLTGRAQQLMHLRGGCATGPATFCHRPHRSQNTQKLLLRSLALGTCRGYAPGLFVAAYSFRRFLCGHHRRPCVPCRLGLASMP